MSGLLLTSTPVSAVGLGVDFGLGVRSEKHSTNASMKADLEAKADRYEERHEDRKHGSGSSITAHIKVQERMVQHLTSKVKRSVTALVQLQKRICGASSDQTVVNACIAKAKIDIKASINAMIDIAFGS